MRQKWFNTEKINTLTRKKGGRHNAAHFGKQITLCKF